MVNSQRIINLTALTAGIIALVILNGQIAEKSKPVDLMLDLTATIAKGEPLSEQEQQDLKQLLKSQIRRFHSPLCFLDAYNKLVLEQGLSSQIFQLFSQPHFEYAGVRNCSHYLAVLAYHAAQWDSLDQPKLLKALQELQPRVNRNKQERHICVLMKTGNNEGSIKQQVKQLAQQDYPRTSIVVLSDGSTDNTPIFGKYSYDQLSPLKQQDLIFLHHSNATGSLTLLPSFLKEHCEQDSIVLMLEGSEALLDNMALKRVDEIFVDQQVQVAHFQAFSTPHINVEASAKVNGEKMQIALAPVLAFRTKNYQQLGQDFPTKVNSGDFKDIERQLLSSHLLKNKPNLQSFHSSPDILVFRSQLNQTIQATLAQKLSTL